jgi:hypothetical protein
MLKLFRKIVAVHCENHTKCRNMLQCGQNYEFSLLKQAVHNCCCFVKAYVFSLSKENLRNFCEKVDGLNRTSRNGGHLFMTI